MTDARVHHRAPKRKRPANGPGELPGLYIPILPILWALSAVLHVRDRWILCLHSSLASRMMPRRLFYYWTSLQIRRCRADTSLLGRSSQLPSLIALIYPFQ